MRRGGRGLFVSVEGIDGSGKSTQARLLAARLKAEGELALLLRDPGSTELGEAVRTVLLAPGRAPAPDPLAEVALFLAARVQLLRQRIEPALSQGHVVVCDRYLDSTLAYQGFGRDLDQGRLLELHRLLGAARRPDLTLLLDLAPAEARARLRGSGPEDRMELEPTAYHERVRQGYLALAGMSPERVVVLPGDRPKDDLAESCWRLTLERLSTRRAE
ncbi:MAG: dTMP kinase [Candidatus Dormibacteria bacterium]